MAEDLKTLAGSTSSPSTSSIMSASDSVKDDENTPSSSTTTTLNEVQQRRKDLFGDCALVEIIHLHDCLRGAINALEKDLTELSRMVLDDEGEAKTEKSPQQQHRLLTELESRATARFQVIWSVFRAHSAAEDEFIWPTLRSKTQGRITGSPCCQAGPAESEAVLTGQVQYAEEGDGTASAGGCEAMGGGSGCAAKAAESSCCDAIEQEEYEEDHADEERMFTMMDHLLTRLRKGLSQQRSQLQKRVPTMKKNNTNFARVNLINTMKEIQSLNKTLNQHLMVHLEKEEQQCMPLVVKHLSKSEIHDLVGQIMGKRSSDMIAQILAMAIQNLNEADKEEMVKHMKQAMVGTFFDRWLSMSGLMDGRFSAVPVDTIDEDSILREKRPASAPVCLPSPDEKRRKFHLEQTPSPVAIATPTGVDNPDATTLSQSITPTGGITSQAELEKLIRAVATNQSLTPVQKNTTIQGLRTSVWKRNHRLIGSAIAPDHAVAVASAASTTTVRSHPPAAYYRMNAAGERVLAWQSTDGNAEPLDSTFVPRFSAAELAPTYHDGTTNGAVLGCHHYARACKLRHPLSGRLYTCRLCCEQEREAPTNDADEPLDRYAVTEVSCMKCISLQPANKYCVNTDCELHEKGFANYYCDICHLYDDRPRPIFHCPYCNTCRMGLGLGIDFRHCMRCNACVSLEDKEHRCIPQKLQGSCPICRETLFVSTEPLKGLKCGHVMHLSCFTEYRRGQNYTCPLCMRCMEDMSDYFSLLDQAVRLQAMPVAYQNTICNIYCQDCEKTGQCRYHFVGQKCEYCGSYNTRDMGRFEAAGN